MSMMPEDYENLDEYLKAVEEARKAGRTYSGLSSLSERSGTSEVKLSGDDTDNETLMLAKFGYSMPPAMITKMATKLWGYLRDGNISDELQQLAVKSTNALADQVLNAPCTNRQGRMEYEKDQAQFWENEAKALGGTEPDYKALLHKWSSAYAFCQQVRIISETKGIAVARPYFREYELMEQQMSDAEMDISRLPMAYNSMCWCHIRHFKIQKERAYAIAMDWPIEDFTEFKKKVAKGEDIHDLTHMAPWPWKESYNQVLGSMMDGQAHRLQQAMLIAGRVLDQGRQQPMAPQQPYGPPQGAPEGEEDEKKKAIFGMRLGNHDQNGQQQQGPEPKRRIRSKRE